uniref:Reverse transcriptase domain-containing protein n=1 Tax=Cacopsylla melanoneura TaxID=428564 RepID=A0A8D9BZC5_9HEMI
MDEMYGYIKFKAESLKNQASVATATSVALAASQSNTIKLQPLDIPTFSGNIGEWPLFYQLFKFNVFDRTDLPKSHKLQYLLSKIQGRAASMSVGIPPTEDNLDVIWNGLVEKYEDQRNLASYYMDLIYNFKPLKTEGAGQLGVFADKIGSTVAALKALKLNNLNEFMLFYLAQAKLDDNTKRLFEQSLDSTEIPTFEKLLAFTQNQVKVLSRLQNQGLGSKMETPGSNNNIHSNSKYQPFHKGRVHTFHVNDNDKPLKTKCYVCNNNHDIASCKQFLLLSPQDRYGVAKKHLLCVNCLMDSHKSNYCVNKPNCIICNANHNTLLHFPQGKKFVGKGKPVHAPSFSKRHAQVTQPSQPLGTSSSNVSPCTAEEKQVENVFSSVCAETEKGADNDTKTVLLSTVKVKIYNCNGIAQELRFLLDGGSMCNLITESACKKLNLTPEPSKTVLSGIGSSKIVQGQVMLKLSSVHDDRINYTIQALVVGKIVDNLPVVQIDCANMNYLEHITLADNEFMLPGVIDGILGASIYAHILDGKTVLGNPNQPVAVSTKLGYIVMGDAPILDQGPSKQNKLCLFQKTEIDQKLERFWELDQVENCSFSKLTANEIECEQHYVDHVSRDVTGRYTVSLPFSGDVSQLGDSFYSAKKRFFHLENKLNSNPEAKEGYTKSMQDLLDKGYMAKSTDQSDKSGYFIPHHMIVKPDRVSTKIRVVFDASAKTSSGQSLNDLLHTGATLYNDLLGILLKFRLFPCALNGDITSMFLQILVNENDCKFQKLLWRFDLSQPLTTYEMKVVIFGMKSSPFLAQRTVRQLVDNEIKNYPGASKICEYLYMDDCVASFLSEDETKLFYSDVVQMFRSGGFTFTKWISNSKDVLSVIPETEQLTKMLSFDHEHVNTKILGLSWNATEDALHFKIVQQDKQCTKRGILSAVLSIYDPLGLLGPIVLWVKRLIQEICILKLDWDATLPDNILSSWLLFKTQLMELENLTFPRHIGVEASCEFSLVGFCDASERGYGAIVYSKVQLSNGRTVVNLVCVKSNLHHLK